MREHGRARNTVPPSPPKIDAREFAALREFLRGYLHEDYLHEHGSLQNAVRHFAQDAEPDGRAAVLRQWQSFLELTRPQPLPVIARLLNSSLGSAWIPRHPGELEELTKLLQKIS